MTEYTVDLSSFNVEADTLEEAEKKAEQYLNGDPLGLICGIIKQ